MYHIHTHDACLCKYSCGPWKWDQGTIGTWPSIHHQSLCSTANVPIKPQVFLKPSITLVGNLDVYIYIYIFIMVQDLQGKPSCAFGQGLPGHYVPRRHKPSPSRSLVAISPQATNRLARKASHPQMSPHSFFPLPFSFPGLPRIDSAERVSGWTL